MRIELFNKSEMNVDTLTDIWYQGSVQAHDFISPDYWHSKIKDMRDQYIPMSETYVIYDQSEIAGFVSMVDDYLAALFIHPHYQGNGYGKELLNFIKGQKSKASLKVYKKNESAVRFYERNGFVIKEMLLDENTKHEELLMEWEE
ncbi:N-acetyltransferase [Halalkalibacter krulwichiae]|uniref:N-acetyltransferase n=1 Tax=Halalkalibacter krulwichiae TaxID=199441 RepID=UPI00082567AA